MPVSYSDSHGLTSPEQPQGQVGAPALQKVREAVSNIRAWLETSGAHNVDCTGKNGCDCGYDRACEDATEAISIISQCEGDRDLQADRERLNWLERKKYSYERSRSFEFSLLQFIPEGHGPLREAIDAAMKAGRGE